ncbi:MAG: alpha/beta fold hydrolase [Pyrinomonadaceae bacterium]|nr:alpha/beta fold hydrolase [Pyrinomonadaceae bacterium]
MPVLQSQIANLKSQISTSGPEDARTRIHEIARLFAAKPFRPHPLLKSGHAQTVAGYGWPRRFNLRAHRMDEARLFRVEPDVSMLAHCRWQPDRQQHPTIILLHGLEGSSISVYVLSTAHKAYQAGFNVLRLNMRNCGGTEHLTPTLYNSGMTSDLEAVIHELTEQDGLRRILLAGYSMGGQLILKLAGERGAEMPESVVGLCAISPSIDLRACADQIARRSNWVYQRRFLRSLQRRMRHKQQLYPDVYDISDLHRVRSIRDFDNRYTARHGGYRDADDYYARASALQFVQHIERPTLIIHAQDDPFVPFSSFLCSSIAENSHILFLAPPHGGHVGFVARAAKGEDRFWAENRIVEFCRFASESA